MLILERANVNDAQEIHEIKRESFADLLNKYHDNEYSPGAEKLDRTIQKLLEPATDYYFITVDKGHIGALRISNLGKLCKLKQIFILPKYQGCGYAQKAITIAESLYPSAEIWELGTIMQEEKLCYLYEKMGYKKNGKIEHIKDGMDIVIYSKCK